MHQSRERGGMRAVFVCLLALAAVVAQDHAEADYQMALTGSYVPAGETVSSGELINGDYAEDTSEDSLQRGPKVNGGFALNVIPTKKAGVTNKVANADCAGGYFVNGKCVHPFPRAARKATVDDNMMSPEQHTEAGFEVDIHSFVRKHFGQRLMEETTSDAHHVAMPGMDITNFEMNKAGNLDANEAAEDLFPVGTDMMTDGNSELDVKLHKAEMNVRHHVATPKYQHEHVAIAHASSPDSHPTTPSAATPSGSQEGGSSGASSGSTAEAAASVSSDAPSVGAEAGAGDSAVVASGGESDAATGAQEEEVAVAPENGSEEYAAPPPLSEQGEEVAENASPIVEVEDETGDVETQIPHEEVEPEAGLPPTPTPTPTPNYEEIAREEAERAAHHAEVEQCIALLEKDEIQCSNTPAENEAMGGEASASLAAGALVQSAARVEPLDLRSKFQALLLDCTSKSAQNLALANTDTATSERSAFTASVAKYASAMACVDAAEFPSCMPPEAAVTLDKPRPEWTCF